VRALTGVLFSKYIAVITHSFNSFFGKLALSLIARARAIIVAPACSVILFCSLVYGARGLIAILRS
jgi:hypothetical protein